MIWKVNLDRSHQTDTLNLHRLAWVRLIEFVSDSVYSETLWWKMRPSLAWWLHWLGQGGCWDAAASCCQEEPEHPGCFELAVEDFNIQLFTQRKHVLFVSPGSISPPISFQHVIVLWALPGTGELASLTHWLDTRQEVCVISRFHIVLYEFRCWLRPSVPAHLVITTLCPSRCSHAYNLMGIINGNQKKSYLYFI